jgi:hypothetical protein
MKMQRLVVLAGAMFALGIGGSLAYADELVATVQFPFKAGGKEFPSGKYMLRTNDQDVVTIENLSNGTEAVLPFVARVQPRNIDKGSLVFDRAGHQYFLSEVLMPGIDGFLVKPVPAELRHAKNKVGGK